MRPEHGLGDAISAVAVRELPGEDPAAPGGHSAIRVRLYDPARDASLPFDRAGIEPGASRDTVLIAERGGEFRGVLAVRLVPLVHGFQVVPGMTMRPTAEALYQYAAGYVRASGMIEALILVEPANTAMQRFVEERASEEDPAKIYRATL